MYVCLYIYICCSRLSNRNSNTGSSVRKESSERVPSTNCGTSAESAAVQTTTSETEEMSSTKSSESPEIENGKARSTKISDAQHIEVRVRVYGLFDVCACIYRPDIAAIRIVIRTMLRFDRY